MSVILDALKRVQDENRRRGTGADRPRMQAPSTHESNSLLRRLSAPAESRPNSRERTVSPAVGMAVLTLGLAGVLAAALWVFQPKFSGPEANRNRPLLADLSRARQSSVARNASASPQDGLIATPKQSPAITEPFTAIPSVASALPGDMSDLSGQLQVGSDPSTGSGDFRLDSSNGTEREGYFKLTTQQSGPSGSMTARGNRASSTAGVAGRASVPKRLIDPGVRDAFARGVRAQKQGDLGAAEEAYKRALKYDPDNARVNVNLGVLYEQLGRFPLAERHLRRSIAVETDNANAHNNLGVVLYRLGNYDAAMLEFNRTLVIDPRRLDAYTNRGLIFTRWGQHREAENSFKQVLELDPSNALAHYNLGMVYEELHRPELAAEHYYQFLSLGGSDHPRITEYLGPHLEWMEIQLGEAGAGR